MGDFAGNASTRSGGSSKEAEGKEAEGKPAAVRSTNSDCVLQLRNSIGVVIDSKPLPFVPKYMYMSDSAIVLANDRTVMTYIYTSSYSGAAVEEEEELEPNDRMPGETSSSAGGASNQRTNAFVNKSKIFDITTIHTVMRAISSLFPGPHCFARYRPNPPRHSPSAMTAFRTQSARSIFARSSCWWRNATAAFID